MNIKKTAFTSILSGSIFLNLVSPVFAQSPTLNPRLQRVEERQAVRQDAREERVEARTEKRCEIASNRIDVRITNYQNNSSNVEARMTNVTKRTNEFIDRLELKGYDVAKVRSDLKKLEEMRNTRRTLYTAFINKLQEAKKYACGESEGAFKSALEESRVELKKWADQIKANREYINTTLRSDLQALRGQNPDPAKNE